MTKVREYGIEMAEVRKDIEHIKNDFSEFKSSQRNLDIKFDKFVDEFRQHAIQEKELLAQELKKQDEKNENKYADKRYEKAANYVLGVIAVIIITAVMYLILK